MGAFGRSWAITKTSFAVIGKDKEMLLFPLLAGFFSLAFGAALLVPTVIVGWAEDTTGSYALAAVDYVLIFISYFVLAFIATFFNVCTVHTAKTRFEGGDATFFDSIKMSLSKIHLILAWSLLSASVGLLLRILDRVAQRSGLVGRIIIGILVSLLGMAWSIVTIFVVPAMVYEGVGPFEAIKRSTQTLRQTWGESLIRHYGLGLAQLPFIILGVLLAVGLFMGLGGLGTTGIIAATVVTAVYFVLLFLVFSVANTVFNVALYAYANGQPFELFETETLAGAFSQKQGRFS